MARLRVAHGERTELTVELILAALIVLGLAKVGQNFVVAPSRCTFGRPAVVIGAVAADIDHRVDRARPAESFAARQVDEPAVEGLLGLAHIIPIVLVLADQTARQRNLDFRGFIRAAGLDQRYLDRRVLGESCGEDAAGGARAHNDIIRKAVGHWRSLPGWF